MAIPKQVEQQLKEIEELEKAMQAPEGQTTDPQPEPQADPVAEVPSEAEPTPVEPVKAEPQEDWQAKYQTLQGKYSAEVPRLHQQNKELSSALAELQAKVEELSKPKPVEQVQDRLITEKDEEAFGADLVEMVRRAQKEVLQEAQKTFSTERQELLAEINTLKAQLDNTSTVVSNTTFEQRLSRAIPDFDQLNTSPKWIAWLDEVDAYTGQPRRAYAEYQYGQGNVVEVKRIVDLYKSMTGYGQQQQEQQQRQKELERQVQPSRNASSSAQSQPAAKFYTEAEASRLFDRVRQLNIQGKHDEASSLEAELTNAYTQGRVRG